ncbi:MAG: wax ester/triacylglycerol synthase family O-acyltransferase [Deltaproteobacteria bacterium]|nr:wax ester/triacylglycerol synthase family O-acyltransferase [Deltaproteobacteria bacterium]
MTYAHFERLSALDNSFLGIEDGVSHMHIGSVAIFEKGQFGTPAGGVDIEAIRSLMESELHRVPRYRQRLRRTPIFDQPVWVDDPHFNLNYHVRHTHLPLPGDDRQLKRLAARLMSQALDRGRPLWEMWVVEGLPDDRFAIVTKVHHCMIDGVGSVRLTGALLRPTPDRPTAIDPPPSWIPRPEPSPTELVVAELAHRIATPARALAAGVRAAAQPARALGGARDIATALGASLGAGLRSASPTPLNVPIGPHRRFDWTTADMEALKAVRARHGGTVNDVVLTVLAGALRAFLRRRGLDPNALDFRVMVPVNVRDTTSRDEVGNRVAMIVVRLPLAERDPLERLRLTVAETMRVKRSQQAAGTQLIEALSDATFPALMVQFANLTALARPFNVVVTNVPGPPIPVYIHGARMLAAYPLVPLFTNQALGIALLSYAGTLHWGFNADWDALPDLHELVEAVERELAALATLAIQAPVERADPTAVRV